MLTSLDPSTRIHKGLLPFSAPKKITLKSSDELDTIIESREDTTLKESENNSNENSPIHNSNQVIFKRPSHTNNSNNANNTNNNSDLDKRAPQTKQNLKITNIQLDNGKMFN